MLLYINPCKAGVYVNENIEIERSDDHEQNTGRYY